MNSSFPAYRRYGILLLAAMLLVLGAVYLWNPRDPWHDEAMLGYNLVAENLRILSPLPFFEQAAPIGYVAAARAMLALLPEFDQTAVLRLVSLLGICAGFAAIGALLLRAFGTGAVAIFVGLVLSSTLLWTYETEIKHYGFEFAATSVLLLAGWHLAVSDRARDRVLFLCACLLAAVFSFTAPLAIAAVGFGLVAARLWQTYRASRTPAAAVPAGPAAIVSGMAVAALGLGIALLIYAAINQDLVRYQLSAYDFVYERDRLALFQSPVENVKLLLRLEGLLLDVFNYSALRSWLARVLSSEGMASLAMLGVGTLFLLACLAFTLRRSVFLATTALGLVCVLVAANLVGKFPFQQSRHVLFAAPILLAVAAVGLAELIGFLTSHLPRRLRWAPAVLAALVLVPASASGLRSGATRQDQELSPLLAEIEARDPAVPVWIYAGAQPAVLMLAPSNLTLLGMLDNRSADTSWMVRGNAVAIDRTQENPWQRSPIYPATLAPAVAGHDAVWLLFAHDYLEAGRDAYLRAAEAAVGPCTLAASENDAEIYRTALYHCVERLP